MNASNMKPANFTRRTANLPAKFARESRFDLLALYHLLRLSDLAREGIEHSGSYRFADHLYRNEASGRGWLGRWLDRCLLTLPASQAMRSRCARSSEEMQRVFKAHLSARRSTPFRILTVPCGIPRDVRNFAGQLAAQNPELLSQVEYVGMDLDPEVVSAAKAFLDGSVIEASRIVEGNALDRADYGAQKYDFIASTGLGEFLGDEDLGTFYGNVFDALAPGGTFFTSAHGHERKSDALLRAFEFNSHYRTCSELERLLARQAWKAVTLDLHSSGLQTFARAIKG
jgi:Putative methyltransferase